MNLTIIPAVTPPGIALAPLSRTFTAMQGAGNPASRTISVTNNGGGTLSGLAIGTIGYTGGANGWLAATLNQATAPATITLRSRLETNCEPSAGPSNHSPVRALRSSQR